MLVATPAITTWVTPRLSQVLLQAGVGERSPRPFGHRVVCRLLVQLRDQDRSIRQGSLECCASVLLGRALHRQR